MEIYTEYKIQFNGETLQERVVIDNGVHDDGLFSVTDKPKNDTGPKEFAIDWSRYDFS